MKAQFFVNLKKQWELSRIHHDTELGIDPLSSNPASVFLTAILSPPLIYVVVVLVLMGIFMCLVCVFKEEMKPCLFSTLDVLSSIGLVCFNILVYIFSWVKAIAYPVKEFIFKITDEETWCDCCCWCFRFKNPIFTGERSGKEVRWGRRGHAPSVASFHDNTKSMAEHQKQKLGGHTAGFLMEPQFTNTAHMIENVNFSVKVPTVQGGPRFHDQQREDNLRNNQRLLLEKEALPVALASAAAGNDGDQDDCIVATALRAGEVYEAETAQELSAMEQGATRIVRNLV